MSGPLPNPPFDTRTGLIDGSKNDGTGPLVGPLLNDRSASVAPFRVRGYRTDGKTKYDEANFPLYELPLPVVNYIRHQATRSAIPHFIIDVHADFPEMLKRVWVFVSYTKPRAAHEPIADECLEVNAFDIIRYDTEPDFRGHLKVPGVVEKECKGYREAYGLLDDFQRGRIYQLVHDWCRFRSKHHGAKDTMELLVNQCCKVYARTMGHRNEKS